jgi:uncharacterized membrane protein YccC
MKLEIKNTVVAAYFALAIVEVILYGLTGLLATYLVGIALASAATGHGIRQGYWWASIVMWATFVVSLSFASFTAYASVSLGSSSIPLGAAMIALAIASIVLPIYSALNWSKLVPTTED